MSIKHAFVVAASAALAVLLPPAQARAAACGTYTIPTATGRDLVFGEASTAAGVGNGRLAICHQPVGGTTKSAQTYYEFAAGTCGSSTTSADWVEIFGSSAGDRISPLFSTTGLIQCGTGTKYIKPFAWSLRLAAAGNGGGDYIFGTPNNDTLQSGTNSSAAADSNLDILCGFDGNDWLIGDGDDSFGHEECLEGGNGTDVCDAVWPAALSSDTNAGDAWFTCEATNGNFASNYRATGSCNCAVGYQYFWVSPTT